MSDNEDRTPGADRAPSNTTPDAARLTAAIDQFLWPKYLNGADGPARSWQFYQDLKWLGEHVADLLTAESENARLTAALDRANRALDEIIALDEKGPAWEPRDVFGDPSDIDLSNSGDQRRHGAWTAYQYAAKIARAARTQPETSND